MKKYIPALLAFSSLGVCVGLAVGAGFGHFDLPAAGVGAVLGLIALALFPNNQRFFTAS